MTPTSIMLKLSGNEFGCLLATLLIDEIPGVPNALASRYLGLDQVALDEGLEELTSRGLVIRTDTGVAIAEDLLAALLRFQRPSLVAWALTTTFGPIQHLVDVIGDSTGFTGVILQADESVDVLLVPSREAVAELLVSVAGVTTRRPEFTSSSPAHVIGFGRAVELVHHALGKPGAISPPASTEESILAQTTSFTTFSFWDIATDQAEPAVDGIDGSVATAPNEFAVAVAESESWLLGVTDVDGNMVIIPVDATNVVNHILGQPLVADTKS